MIWIDIPDHQVEPVVVTDRLPFDIPDTICQFCGGCVRTWSDGSHPIHAEPRPQRMQVPCDHRHVERDDDGVSRYFFTCSDCRQEVVATEPDEDGEYFWEAI